MSRAAATGPRSWAPGDLVWAQNRHRDGILWPAVVVDGKDAPPFVRHLQAPNRTCACFYGPSVTQARLRDYSWVAPDAVKAWDDAVLQQEHPVPKPEDQAAFGYALEEVLGVEAGYLDPRTGALPAQQVLQAQLVALCEVCGRGLEEREAGVGRCCSSCLGLAQAGQVCGVCRRVWLEGEVDLAACGRCQRRVHTGCDPQQEQQLRAGRLYQCPSCRAAAAREAALDVLQMYRLHLGHTRPAAPRSPYQVFAMEQLQQAVAGPSSALGYVQLEALAPGIRAAWQQLEDKGPYEQQAAAELEHYEATKGPYQLLHQRYVALAGRLAVPPTPHLALEEPQGPAAPPAPQGLLELPALPELLPTPPPPLPASPADEVLPQQRRAAVEEAAAAQPAPAVAPAVPVLLTADELADLPAEVELLCSGTTGVLELAAVRVRCSCKACRTSGAEPYFTPTQWEQHCGAGAAKKWKVSLRVAPGSVPECPEEGAAMPLGRWLEMKGLDVRPGGKLTRLAPAGEAAASLGLRPISGPQQPAAPSPSSAPAAAPAQPAEEAGPPAPREPTGVPKNRQPGSWAPWQDVALGQYRPIQVRWAGDRCAVCDLDVDYDTDQMVACEGCGIAVHQSCYGIPELPGPEELWRCAACTAVETGRPVAGGGRPQCALCPLSGGALKPTTLGGLWCHAACMQWIPEVTCLDPTRMEPIDRLEHIQKERWELMCCVCRQRMGAKVQCASCYTAFHPLCGRLAGLSLEVQEPAQPGGQLRLVAACAKHCIPKPGAAGVSLAPGETLRGRGGRGGLLPGEEEEGGQERTNNRSGLWNAQPWPPPRCAPPPLLDQGCSRAMPLDAQRTSHGTGTGCTSTAGFWMPTAATLAARPAAVVELDAAGGSDEEQEISSSGRPGASSGRGRGGRGRGRGRGRSGGRGWARQVAAAVETSGAGDAAPPYAELVLLPEGVPEEVEVVCNGRSGVLLLRSQRVAVGSSEMTASRFEALAGRADAKKWKSSLWVVDEAGEPAQTVAAWLDARGLDRAALADLAANAAAVEAYHAWAGADGSEGGQEEEEGEGEGDGEEGEQQQDEEDGEAGGQEGEGTPAGTPLTPMDTSQGEEGQGDLSPQQDGAGRGREEEGGEGQGPAAKRRKVAPGGDGAESTAQASEATQQDAAAGPPGHPAQQGSAQEAAAAAAGDQEGQEEDGPPGGPLMTLRKLLPEELPSHYQLAQQYTPGTAASAKQPRPADPTHTGAAAAKPPLAPGSCLRGALPRLAARVTPDACVGHSCRLYWTDDAAWYTADVRYWDAHTGHHQLWYHADEVMEWIDLAEEDAAGRVQWLPTTDASSWPPPPRSRPPPPTGLEEPAPGCGPHPDLGLGLCRQDALRVTCMVRSPAAAAAGAGVGGRRAPQVDLVVLHQQGHHGRLPALDILFQALLKQQQVEQAALKEERAAALARREQQQQQQQGAGAAPGCQQGPGPSSALSQQPSLAPAVGPHPPGVGAGPGPGTSATTALQQQPQAPGGQQQQQYQQQAPGQVIGPGAAGLFRQGGPSPEAGVMLLARLPPAMLAALPPNQQQLLRHLLQQQLQQQQQFQQQQVAHPHQVKQEVVVGPAPGPAVVLDPPSGEQAVGWRVGVPGQLQGSLYYGWVAAWDGDSATHQVVYDDGTSEWVDTAGLACDWVGPAGREEAARAGAVHRLVVATRLQLAPAAVAVAPLPPAGLPGSKRAAADAPAAPREPKRQAVRVLLSGEAPAAVSITCGNLTGTFHVREGTVTLGDGSVVSPTEFERLGGKASAKKWKASLRVVPGQAGADPVRGAALGDWLAAWSTAVEPAGAPAAAAPVAAAAVSPETEQQGKVKLEAPPEANHQQQQRQEGEEEEGGRVQEQDMQEGEQQEVKQEAAEEQQQQQQGPAGRGSDSRTSSPLVPRRTAVAARRSSSGALDALGEAAGGSSKGGERGAVSAGGRLLSHREGCPCVICKQARRKAALAAGEAPAPEDAYTPRSSGYRTTAGGGGYATVGAGEGGEGSSGPPLREGYKVWGRTAFLERGGTGSKTAQQPQRSAAAAAAAATAQKQRQKPVLLGKRSFVRALPQMPGGVRHHAPWELPASRSWTPQEWLAAQPGAAGVAAIGGTSHPGTPELQLAVAPQQQQQPHQGLVEPGAAASSTTAAAGVGRRTETWRERLRVAREDEARRIVFGKSGIHGWGIFARRPIPQDALVVEFRGQEVRAALAEGREVAYRAKGRDCYMFRATDDVVLDNTGGGSLGRFINHCCQPCCYTRVLELRGRVHLAFFARNDIAAGQELTFDYRFKEEGEEAKVACACGAPACRGTLN